MRAASKVWLMLAVALFSIAAVFGVIVARHNRRSGAVARIAQWERKDFIREAALWGFHFASFRTPSAWWPRR